MSRRPVPTEIHARVDNSWEADAACKDHPTDLFFPTETSPAYQATIARSICNTCTVRDACLDAALRRNELYGIWGGLNIKERRRERRRRGDLTRRLICQRCRTEFDKPVEKKVPMPYCSRACQKAAANRQLYLQRPVDEERTA